MMCLLLDCFYYVGGCRVTESMVLKKYYIFFSFLLFSTVEELCDGDLVWSNCSDCIRTCDNLNVDCASMCGTEGCKCPDGLVQLNKESKQCLQPQECPCKHNGIKYQNGEKIRKDCNLW